MTTHEIMAITKSASPSLSRVASDLKNKALLAMADAIIENSDNILAANAEDVEAARSTVSDVMLDRLRLTENSLAAMANGIRDVAALPDPVGRIISETFRPNGLVIQKVSVPLGVTAIIYESRPNVTSDAAALSIKSGNACILRSGKEAFHSAKEIVIALKKGLTSVGMSADLINIIEDTTRQSAYELMKGVGYIDLLIPRGGAGLIRSCVENALVPCIQTGTGICHIYVDKSADQDMALKIIENAKTSRPSVCNAAEVCLVHKDIAGNFLPKLKSLLVDDRNSGSLQPVELRVDEKAASIICGTPASDSDFSTEFLDYILAVAVVDSIDSAIAHIAAHSTGHSESIITSDSDSAELFISAIDSAAVYVNSSTRFTDGGEFGLGCEMGISTQKLHARGPMGLEELNTYKYVIRGNGHIR